MISVNDSRDWPAGGPAPRLVGDSNAPTLIERALTLSAQLTCQAGLNVSGGATIVGGLNVTGGRINGAAGEAVEIGASDGVVDLIGAAGASGNQTVRFNLDAASAPVISTPTGTGIRIDANLGIGAAPSSTTGINLTQTTATLTRALLGTLTYTGSASTPDVSGLGFTAVLGVNSSSGSTFRGVNAAVGKSALLTLSNAGTHAWAAVLGAIGSNTVGSRHTAGDIYAAAILGSAAPSWSLTAPATFTYWAGRFEDDLQVNTAKKLLLSGSSTAKGGDYLVVPTLNTQIDAYVNSVKQLTIDTTGVVLPDGKNVATGTTTGTMFGTSPTQKQGWWGVTPIVQPADVPVPANNTGEGADAQLNQVSGTGDDFNINTNFATLFAHLDNLRNVFRAVGIHA